jgi:CRP-like cAMP-binding protein
MLATLDDGDAAQVGVVGREGMVGLPLLGTDRDPVEAVCQAGGTALRLGAGAFRDALERGPALRALLLRSAKALNAQVAQTRPATHAPPRRAAVRALDADGARPLRRRCVPDDPRVPVDDARVRRAGVTVAAGALPKADLVRHGNSRMAIADRPGLEAAARDCHGTVRREFERLLGPTTRS